MVISMRDFWGSFTREELTRRIWNMLFWAILRMALGMGSIYYINQFLAKRQIDLYVGWNLISLLTTGGLGFGGVVLLYAVNACKFL